MRSQWSHKDVKDNFFYWSGKQCIYKTFDCEIGYVKDSMTKGETQLSRDRSNHTEKDHSKSSSLIGEPTK